MNERHFRLYERIVAIEDSLEALGLFKPNKN